MDADDNPRPLKRQRRERSQQRVESLLHQTISLPLSPPPETVSIDPERSSSCLSPLPPSILLLSIPSFLIHPPAHKYHLQSLVLSQRALRRCLILQDPDQDIECRAWTGLAEIGMCMGLEKAGVESEVEKALTKGLLIAQKHPSLRSYSFHLTLLSSRLSEYQHNTKFAQNTLRRLIASSLLPSDPPHIAYAAHLALIHSYETSQSHVIINSSMNSVSRLPAHKHKASLATSNIKSLAAIQDLYQLATHNGHGSIALLALTLRLRMLISHGVWDQVAEALSHAEDAFTTALQANGSSSGDGPNTHQPDTESDTHFQLQPIAPTTPLPMPAPTSTLAVTTLHIHLLIMGVLYHTYAGDALQASARLKTLYALLDGGALNAGDGRGDGVVEIPFLNNVHPLYLQTTHPRILYLLAFLLSAVAKRDAVGRRPKRALFAREGLGALESEAGDFDNFQREQKMKVSGKEIALPHYAPLRDLDDIRQRMIGIKADLLGELTGVLIMRSEFDEAERVLNILIAHVRTHGLFPAYAARITLQQAQLAHALGRGERAVQCYRVAGWLARGGGRGGCEREWNDDGEVRNVEGDRWVEVAAKAGEVWVRIGMVRSTRAGSGAHKGSGDDNVRDDGDIREALEKDRKMEGEIRELMMIGAEVATECEGLGGTLMAVGEVIKACLADEFLKAKQHLRRALGLATAAEDNHLRALVLALISSHYLHTARDRAGPMLITCEQIAAGLGAQPVKRKEKSMTAGGGGDDGVGNAQLRLWVGERFLELHRWSGELRKVERQVEVNARLREAVRRVERRGVDESVLVSER